MLKNLSDRVAELGVKAKGAIRREINTVHDFIQDERGDMAEKGVVLAVIILACLAMWQTLGAKIGSWVDQVSNAY
jgi:Flp pilus assembly pilin Flp